MQREQYLIQSLQLLTEECFRYVQRYKWDDVLQPTYTHEHLKIEGCEEEGLFMILMEGTEDALEQISAYLEDIMKKVKTKRFRIDSISGVTTGVSDIVSDIEQKCACVMKYRTTRTHTDVSGEQRQDIVYSRVPNVQATRVRGYLDNIQSAEVDVIVNTTNTRLSLQVGQGVSKAIARAGGGTIQEQLKQKYPDGIDYGEVAVSGSGKLTNCKAVYHGALPMYKGIRKVQLDHCHRMLVLFIFNCLNMATAEGRKSIAFPALGTGNLQYPLENVVPLLYQTVLRFLDNNPRSSLEEVLFIVYPSAKALIKQLFLMENLSYHLHTVRGDGITPIHRELHKADRGCCEARLQIDNTFIQVINSDVQSLCHITKNILILWHLKDLKVGESNPFLTCVDPGVQEQVYKRYVPQLTKSKCVVDSTSLRDRTVIHSVYTQADVKHAVEAVCRGVKRAIKEGLHTLTVPVVDHGSPLWRSDNAASIIMKAIRETRQLKHVHCIISVAIPNGHTFEPFVSMAMESTDRKLYVSPDVSKVLDLVWESFSSRDQGLDGDAVLTVTSDSEETNIQAAREFEARSGMTILYTMSG